jgi:hypothetical protein
VVKHKHRWTDRFRDKDAYVPDDITQPAMKPGCGLERILCRGEDNPQRSHGRTARTTAEFVLMKPRCTLIQEQMGKLFRCAEVGNYIRIRTPFMYPDGDYIHIFLANEAAHNEATITLSDLGETVRWLKMQTISPRRSLKQNQMIQDICLTARGFEFLQRHVTGTLTAPAHDLALAVTRISQAALRTAMTFRFTFRTRAVESATDQVAEYRTIHPYQRNRDSRCRSGKSWPINFHTRTPEAKFAGPRPQHVQSWCDTPNHRSRRRCVA